MKSIVITALGDTSVLQLQDLPTPEPQGNEVLVKLSYAALNHMDIWIRTGSAYAVTLPHVCGADGAGVVEKIGAEVEGVGIGDKVAIMPALSCGQCTYCKSGHDNQCDSFEILGSKRFGTYSEYVVVPDENVVVVPDGFPLDQAAAFPLAYLTAWHMLLGRAKLQKGETVLIVGASAGVSVAAIQIAKSIGARVLAITTSADKEKQIRSFGADDVHIQKEKADFHRWAKSSTAGQGVDVVFEHVGPATWEESIRSLKKNGRLVTCGATTGPVANLDLRQIFSKDITILGARMGTKKEFQDLSKMVFGGKIKPLISETFPLEKAAEAQKFMEEKRQIGKILLKN